VPRYPGLQHFSQQIDSLISGTWHDKDIRGMIRTLAVNCAPILDRSQDDGKTVAGNTSNDIVLDAVQALLDAVRALCEFSILVCQQNHSDLSLKALDDDLKQYYQKKGIF